MSVRLVGILSVLSTVVLSVLAGCQAVRDVHRTVHPEQTRIEFRPPQAFPRTPLPTVSPPRTVSNPDNGEEDLELSLDEAIRIALQNSEVIRVNAGLTAVSSGQTIYDPGIANAAVDQARGRFDPTLSVNNTFSHNETPQGVFDPAPPAVRIAGSNADFYDLDADLSKTNPLGGTAGLRVGATRTEIEPGGLPLNPQTSHFTELSYVQPLLRGGGLDANLAPILISRLDTERSFFQFKDGMQELVRGVIQAYWALVFARTDRWAREQQVSQSKFAFEREEARLNRGFGDSGQLSQARLAYTSFEADLVRAEADVLQRENALLNILGISPTEIGEVIPVTPPHVGQIEWEWNEVVSLAEQFRPDIIELKLIIEADRQRLLVARNDARPGLDAVALYRWDGLRGRTPAGNTLATNGDAYTDWTLGVNFSVPLGLRQARATVRQQELLIFRDEAELRQGLHSATHQLALSIRNLDQFFQQYEAFRATREAARENLTRQQAAEGQGLVPFITLLQAIVSWGNSVSSEAQSLAQFNTELANLERESGTILETHGVRFFEERFQFAGPLCCREKVYPGAIAPTSNSSRYPTGDVPAEESFDLRDPLEDDPPDVESPPPALNLPGPDPGPEFPAPGAAPANSGDPQTTNSTAWGRLPLARGNTILPVETFRPVLPAGFDSTETRATHGESQAPESRRPPEYHDGDPRSRGATRPGNRPHRIVAEGLGRVCDVPIGGIGPRGSLVSQGVNGIHAAGSAGRVEAEEDAHSRREQNGNTGRWQRNHDRPLDAAGE